MAVPAESPVWLFAVGVGVCWNERRHLEIAVDADVATGPVSEFELQRWRGQLGRRYAVPAENRVTAGAGDGWNPAVAIAETLS